MNMRKGVIYTTGGKKKIYLPKDPSNRVEFKKKYIVQVIFTHTLAKKKLMSVSWYCWFDKLYRAPEKSASFDKEESKFSGKHAGT